jgi:hypothetical protein
MQQVSSPPKDALEELLYHLLGTPPLRALYRTGFVAQGVFS